MCLVWKTPLKNLEVSKYEGGPYSELNKSSIQKYTRKNYCVLHITMAHEGARFYGVSRMEHRPWEQCIVIRLRKNWKGYSLRRDKNKVRLQKENKIRNRGLLINRLVSFSLEALFLSPWKNSYDQPRQHIKKQRHYFTNKGPSSQSYVFSSSHVWIWKLDYKERWAPKNWCFWTMVLEKTLESPLDF